MNKGGSSFQEYPDAIKEREKCLKFLQEFLEDGYNKYQEQLVSCNVEINLDSVC